MRTTAVELNDPLAGSGRGRIESLDVLRGAAVALVLLRHAWPGTFPGAGIVGVVIFFVLSGYLITGVLRRDIESTGKIRYRRFYAHRAFRLLPALIGLVAVYASVELVSDALGDRTKGVIGNTVVIALTYIRDFPLPWESSVAIGPLWTLAVEEQFYLIWPALLLFASKRNRIGRLLIVSVSVTLIAMIATVVVVNAYAQHLMVHLYTLPTTWGAALIAGGALYIYRRPVLSLVASRRVALPASLASCLILAAICLFAEVKESAAFYILGGPVTALAGSVLVALCVARSSALPSWTAPLRLLGVISYGAYLWNYLIVQWLRSDDAGGVSTLGAVASIGLTILAAIVSWFTVERLGRRLRHVYDQKRDSSRTMPRSASEHGA